MRIGVLGPLVVTRDGHDVVLGAAKPRAVLALLALRANELVLTDSLVEGVWNGRPPATATQIIHGYVSQLRKAIGPDVLETLSGGYRLRLAADELDTSRFEDLLHRGRTSLAGSDPAAAQANLREGLRLWRGCPLADFRGYDFAVEETNRLEELRLLARECCLEAEIALGNHVTAIPELQVLIRENPVRESLHRLYLLALYRAGRQADALAAYAEARSVLVESLGVEPGEPLREMQAAILRQDHCLDLPPTAPSSPQTQALALAASTTSPVTPPMPAPTTPPMPPPPAGHPRRRMSPSRRAAALVFCAVVVATSLVGYAHRSGSASDQATPSGAYLGFVGRQTDDVTSRVALSGRPTAVAADGAATWLVDAADQDLVRVDAASSSVTQTIAVGHGPSGVAIGGGSVWVSNHDDNTVSRINPETNTVVQTIPVGVGPAAIAEGFGSVWVTDEDDRTLTRINEGSGLVAAVVDTGAGGRGIAVGGGSIWVSDPADDRILGVDPLTDAVTSIVPVGSGPSGLTYGAGAVWVVNALDGTVSRLDTTARAVTLTVRVVGGPESIGVADQAVWVGTTDSRLARLDPVHGTVTDETVLAGRPVALAATGAGVWVAADDTANSHRGGTLLVLDDVDSIDPSTGAAQPAVLDLTYDTMTSLRRDGSGQASIVPDLAAALPRPTTGGTTYTFQLRPKLTYSNGAAVQAADFRRGLERLAVLDPSAADQLSHIAGVRRCSHRPMCHLTAGVQVQGSSTVTFHLTSPDPRLLEELRVLIPVPDGTPMGDLGPTPVPGTGPYAVSAFVPGKSLVLERNRHFSVWAPVARPDGYPDRIVFHSTADGAGAVRQVTSGTADLVQLFGGSSELTQLEATRPRQAHTEDQQAIVFLFLNTRRAPFDDVRVRRAVNYAVDRQRVVDLYGSALSRPTCQIVPPTATGFEPYCPYTVDPDRSERWRAPDLARARALVKASGTQGQSVVVWTFPDFLAEARYLSDVLETLGYRSSVHLVTDGNAYFGAIDHHPDVQAGMYGWFGDPLAVDMLSTLTCRFTPNPARFCDPTVDRQVRALADLQVVDPERARDLAAAVDREITAQAPWVPLLTPETAVVTSARVGNYRTLDGRPLLDQLWVQ